MLERTQVNSILHGAAVNNTGHQWTGHSPKTPRSTFSKKHCGQKLCLKQAVVWERSWRVATYSTRANTYWRGGVGISLTRMCSVALDTILSPPGSWEERREQGKTTWYRYDHRGMVPIVYSQAFAAHLLKVHVTINSNSSIRASRRLCGIQKHCMTVNLMTHTHKALSPRTHQLLTKPSYCNIPWDPSRPWPQHSPPQHLRS